MLTDTRIIGRVGAYQVVAQRYELQLLDGTLRWLHDVQSTGTDDKYLRAVHRGGSVYTVVDLRRLSRGIGEALAVAHGRDRPGLVWYALRDRYAGARAFDQAVIDHQLAQGEVVHEAVAA